MSLLLDLATYPLPSFLKGRCTPTVYCKWLHNKADTLVKRDKKRGRPYALTATTATYKKRIHEAVIEGGEHDPYTGDLLAWELIRQWDTSHEQPDGYKRKFALMPTVDHVIPDVLEFEICSWQINGAKSDLRPTEFVNLCKRVASHRSQGTTTQQTSHSERNTAGQGCPRPTKITNIRQR